MDRQEHRNHHRNHRDRDREPRPEKSYPEPLATEKITCEEQGKKIYLDLHKNERGIYLKIAEKNRDDRTNTVVIPGEILRDIAEAIARINSYAEGSLQ